MYDVVCNITLVQVTLLPSYVSRTLFTLFLFTSQKLLHRMNCYKIKIIIILYINYYKECI